MLMQCFKLSGLSAGLIRFAYKASKGASIEPPHFLLTFKWGFPASVLVLMGHNPPCMLDGSKSAYMIQKKMRFRDKRLSARIFPVHCFWTFGHFTKLVCDPGANQRVHVFSCSLFQLTLPLGSNIHVHVCFCCHVCTAFASFPSQWSTDHMPQFPYVQLLLDDVPYT